MLIFTNQGILFFPIESTISFFVQQRNFKMQTKNIELINSALSLENGSDIGISIISEMKEADSIKVKLQDKPQNSLVRFIKQSSEYKKYMGSENGYMLLVKDKKAFRIVAFSYQNNNEEDVTNAYEIIQYY